MDTCLLEMINAGDLTSLRQVYTIDLLRDQRVRVLLLIPGSWDLCRRR
jgi:hypothetical protein